MAEITFKDQVELGLQRLITQWQDKPAVVGLLTSYLENIQVVEDIYVQLNDERGLDTAVGSQLDVLGLIIGLLREGRDDDTYRTALKAQVAVNTCDGTESKINEALRIFLGTDDIRIIDNYPAGIEIDAGSLVNPDQEALEALLPQIVAATITVDFSFISQIDPPFVFNGDPDGEGFADVGATTFTYLPIFDTGDNLGTDGGDVFVFQNPELPVVGDEIEGGYLVEKTIISV